MDAAATRVVGDGEDQGWWRGAVGAVAPQATTASCRAARRRKPSTALLGASAKRVRLCKSTRVSATHLHLFAGLSIAKLLSDICDHCLDYSKKMTHVRVYSSYCPFGKLNDGHCNVVQSKVSLHPYERSLPLQPGSPSHYWRCPQNLNHHTN